MVTLLTPFRKKLDNFKCGEVFCEAVSEATNYNVSCCVCSLTVQFIEFPQHFQNLHLSTEQYAAANTDIAKDAAEREMIDLDPSKSVEKVDITCDSCETDTDSYVDDELPIAFMEVRLPKLKVSNANNFIPEHITMDFACFDGVSSEGMNTAVNKPQNEMSLTLMNKELEQDKKTVSNKEEDEVNHTVSPEENTEHLSSCFNDLINNIKTEDNSFQTSSQMKFSCTQCRRVYKSNRGLQHHIRVAHESKVDTPIKRYDLKYKESAEKPSSFVCNICGKSFSCLGNMNTHKKRHSGVKSYKCPECGNYYYTEHEMKSHLMRHTDLLPVICEICGRGFRNTGKLKAHMRRHTGERPAKCDICGKCFFSNHDLNVHHVTHTTDRPFTCEICGSTFRTKKALRVHKKLHVSERAHQCQLCGKAFVQLSGLDSHMQQVHIKSFTFNLR